MSGYKTNKRLAAYRERQATRVRKAEEAKASELRAEAERKEAELRKQEAERRRLEWQVKMQQFEETQPSVERNQKFPEDVHHYFRVYPNGDYAKSLQLTANDKDNLVAYNKIWRGGCAQFVDGKCVYEGAVSRELIESVEAQYTPPVRRPFSDGPRQLFNHRLASMAAVALCLSIDNPPNKT